MAYTKDPTLSTQQTKRFNFVGSNEGRDSSPNKDQRYVNFYIEKTLDVNKSNPTWWLKKRPGLAALYDIGAAGIPRGIFFWNGTVMSVYDNNIFYDGTFLSVIGTATGPVGWTEFLDDLGNRKLILLDGTNGYVFTAPNVAPTQITDPNFPTPHAHTPVFLDGYLFVAKPGTQDIYNSNLNDPLTWTPGDFISAEMYPDSIVGLTRNNNYIYAIGQYSIEFMYDAANDSGSPLRRHDSAVQQFGTPALESVASLEKGVCMIGHFQEGGRTVFVIDGFKEQDIGTPAIQDILNAERENIINAEAYPLMLGGQECYVLVLGDRVLVYGFEEKIWYEWNFISVPRHATDSFNGHPLVIVAHLGRVYIAEMGPNFFTDFGAPITCSITTSKFDFDTLDRKRMDLLTVIGDSPNSGNTPITVQWSDDDYNTWSAARTLNINPIFSRTQRLGMFRRRAIKFTFTAPTALRLEGIEITINRGQT